MSDQIVEIDFTGAPPAQGGQRPVRIPPGPYLLKVKDVEHKMSKRGLPMLAVRTEVAQGEHEGKNLPDWFSLAKGNDGSAFGLQRAHAFLIACGSKQAEGKARIELAKLTNRMVVGIVDDEEQDATEQYDARTVSRVRAYHSVEAWNALNKPQSAPPAPAAAPEVETPAPAPVAAAPIQSAPPAAPDTVEAAAEAADDLFA